MSDLLAGINPRRRALARKLLAGPSPPPGTELQAAVDRSLLRELFRQIAEARGIHLPGNPHPPAIADPVSTPQSLATLPPDILGRVYEHCLAHPLGLDAEANPTIKKTPPPANPPAPSTPRPASSTTSSAKPSAATERGHLPVVAPPTCPS
jgi:hypothetical protein